MNRLNLTEKETGIVIDELKEKGLVGYIELDISNGQKMIVPTDAGMKYAYELLNSHSPAERVLTALCVLLTDTVWIDKEE